MKLLAFDTSTELLSIALQPGAGAAVLGYEGAGGAQASATLIPAIERLLAQAGLQLAQLDAIAFGRGPGSFTGLRTAAAVAQGLGFGAGVPVLAIDTLLAVAEEAHAQSGEERIVALLDARMDEVYSAAYERHDGQWTVRQAPALGRPEDVLVPPGWALAGNAAMRWPAARALLRLAPQELAASGPHDAVHAIPLYIRDKVAQTTEERAAERARKEMNRGPAAGPTS